MCKIHQMEQNLFLKNRMNNKNNKFFKIHYIFILSLLFSQTLSAHIDTSTFDNELSKQEQNYLKDKTITIGIENWEPIIYSEGKNIIDGISADFLKKIIDRYNIKVKYVVKPWHTLLEEFKNKKIDLLPATYYTKDRTKYGLYSSPYFKIKEYLFVNQKNTSIKGFKDLQNRKLAIVKGYGTISIIKKLFPNITIIETKNIDHSVALLLENKVDAIYDSQFVINGYLNNNLLSGVKLLHQHTFKASNIHMFTNIKEPLLHSILQKGLNQIDQNEQNVILHKWRGKQEFLNTTYFLTQEEKNYLKNKKKFTICLKKNWFPYEGSYNYNMSGIGSDYLKIIQRKLKINYRIITSKNLNYDKKFVTKNNCDIKPIKINQYQKENSYFNSTQSIINDYIALVTDINKPFVKEIATLKNELFLVNQNCKGILSFLKTNFPNLKLKITSTRKEAYKMIKEGKAFGFFAPSLVVANDIQKSHATSLKIINYLHDVSFGIGIKSENELLLSIFNKTLNNISEEQKILITNKWISATTEVKKDFTNLYHGLIIIFIISLAVLYRNYLLKKHNKYLQETVKQATSKLKKQNRFYLNSLKNFQSLFDTTNEAIFLHDKSGKIVMVNKSGIEMAGFESMYELLGRNIYDFIPNHEKTKVEEAFLSKEVKLFEMDLYKKDKTIMPTLVSGRDIMKNGEKLRLNTVVDLTELKQKEKVIQQQSKLALMGEMISMIAHQWRQPLNIIGAINMKVETKLEFEGEMNLEQYLPISKSIVEQLEFMSKTIDDFRNFFKPTTGQKETSFLIITNTVKSMVEVLVKNKGISLNIKSEDTSMFYSFENELTQVLLNLINNSVDALLEHKIKNPFIDIYIYKTNEYHILELVDNAGGISQDTIGHIFEPYFSTKLEKHGTGLGLYMSKVIVEEHCGGSLTVKNNSNGATFQIILDR